MGAKHWIALVALAVGVAAGWWLGAHTGTDRSMPPVKAKKDGPCPAGAAPTHWRAPMDPTYIRDKPGKSPMGMDLVAVCPGEAQAPDGVVRIDPALVQSMGVRTVPVARRDLARKVRTVGRVAYDERLVDHVHTKVQGWVERLFVEYEGELVRQGQPLLEIYSPELVSTQEELLLAKRYRDATQGSRYGDVSQGGKDLFEATRRRLELWDVSHNDIERLLRTGEIRKTLILYASTEGVVTRLLVRDGMEVGPNDNLYTIADLSKVWLFADVYEYELPWVREGQKALIELSYLPGRTFAGKVTYIYLSLDPKTRTARVRVELENPELVLKPDMFADVTIETEARPGVLAVPEEAVIRSGRRALVVAVGEAGHFSPREVGLGLDSGDGWVEVRSGLAEAEQVVTSGQFLIDSESKLQEAIQKMLPAAQPQPGQRPMAASTQGSGSMRPGLHEGMDDEGGPMQPETHTEMGGQGGQAMPGMDKRHQAGHAMSGCDGHAAHDGHDMSGADSVCATR